MPWNKYLISLFATLIRKTGTKALLGKRRLRASGRAHVRRGEHAVCQVPSCDEFEAGMDCCCVEDLSKVPGGDATSKDCS